MGLLHPKPLVGGDEVLIVAPARKVDRTAIYQARDLLSSWGLRVRFGKHLFAEHDQFAGTDEERLEDLQAALDDPTAKAILCARGGYGTSRIVDRLSINGFRRHPKWLVGFSDITAIHGWLVDQSAVTLHATMPQLMVRDAETVSAESLRRALFGQKPLIEAPTHPLNRPGVVRGRVVGGNLSMVVHNLGSVSDVATRGRILFLEDLDEYLYHIDRMMVQLRRSGKLAKLAGLVVGTFSDMRDHDSPFGKQAYEIIAEHVADYSYPVGFNFPVGHAPPNMALPMGIEAKLEVGDSSARLVY